MTTKPESRPGEVLDDHPALQRLLGLEARLTGESGAVDPLLEPATGRSRTARPVVPELAGQGLVGTAARPSATRRAEAPERRSKPDPERERRRPTAKPSGRRLPSMGYQPALDGLRAVSVVGVIFYHAGFSWMRGGFFGVEVFFVVSGFLITS